MSVLTSSGALIRESVRLVAPVATFNLEHPVDIVAAQYYVASRRLSNAEEARSVDSRSHRPGVQLHAGHSVPNGRSCLKPLGNQQSTTEVGLPPRMNQRNRGQSLTGGKHLEEQGRM